MLQRWYEIVYVENGRYMTTAILADNFQHAADLARQLQPVQIRDCWSDEIYEVNKDVQRPSEKIV